MKKEQKFRLILEGNPTSYSRKDFGLDDMDDEDIMDRERYNADIPADSADYSDDDLARIRSERAAGSNVMNNFNKYLQSGQKLENIFDVTLSKDGRSGFVYSSSVGGWAYVENRRMGVNSFFNCASSSASLARTIDGKPCLVVYNKEFDASDPVMRKAVYILYPGAESLEPVANAEKLIDVFESDEAVASVAVTSDDCYFIDQNYTLTEMTQDACPKPKYAAPADNFEKPTVTLPFNISYLYTENAKVSDGYKGGYTVYSKNNKYITSVLFGDENGMNKVDDAGAAQVADAASGVGESMHITKYLLNKRLYEAANGNAGGSFAVLVKASSDPGEQNYNFYTDMSAEEFVAVICEFAK